MASGGDRVDTSARVDAPDGGSRPLLRHQAYEALKELIQGGTFPPGSFLSERQLASQLRMSKTPIRYGLERLEAEGFVAISPQQGIVVRELAFHEIVDLFDIREALETFVARRLAGRLTAEQQKRLEGNIQAQARAAAEHDVAGGTRLDAHFHLMLCESLGNQEIIRVMAHLREKLYRVVYRVLAQDAGRLHTSSEEHAEIADAIVRGDGEGAAGLVVRHLEYGKGFLISR